MIAGVPQADEDEDDQSPYALVHENRLAPLPLSEQWVVVPAARESKQDLLQDVDEEEEAESETYFSPDEIGESEHHEAEPDFHSDDIPEDVDVVVEDPDVGQLGIVVREAILEVDDEGESEAEPHRPALEEWFDQRRLLAVLDHGDRQLRHRKDEALVVDPLATQDRHDTDHGQEEGRAKGSQRTSGPSHRPQGTP